MNTSIVNICRLARLVALATVMALSVAAPASARVPVDPSTLNPPPPDFFNAVCNQLGQNIVCTLGFSDPSITNEPSGIVCDGVELLFSQERSVVGKRTYSAAGDLLQRHFREDYSGTYSNPATGRVLMWIAQDTVIHNLTVPGDLSTGTVQITGNQRVFTVGGRTVLVDAGRTVIDRATDQTIFSAGRHPFDDYFARGDANALAPVCAALR